MSLNLRELRFDPSDSPIGLCIDEKPLEWQLEELDPDDPAATSLLAWIDKPVAPGRDDYGMLSGSFRVDVGATVGTDRSLGYKEVIVDFLRLVELWNSKIKLSIALDAATTRNPLRCFGGAVTRVETLEEPAGEILFGLEDPFRSRSQKKLGYELPEEFSVVERELRCLQIDRLYLWDAEQREVAQQDLFDSDFDVVGRYRGPLRVGVTVASKKRFELAIATESGELRYTYCRLYRSFSLDRDADFLLIRTWVRTVDKPFIRPEFRTRTFNLLLWPELEIHQILHPPQFDWLSLRSGEDGPSKFPWPHTALKCSLGYCTDAHTLRVRRHPFSPRSPEFADFSVSWESGKTTFETSAVKFLFSESMDECAHAIGETWYEQVFKRMLGRQM